MLSSWLREEAALCVQSAGQRESRRQGWIRPACQGLQPCPAASLYVNSCCLRGNGKSKPREELAITRLSKRPLGGMGEAPPQAPAHHPCPLSTTLCLPHPPQSCQRILFYTSCLSMSSLSDVHSPSGLREGSSK